MKTSYHAIRKYTNKFLVWAEENTCFYLKLHVDLIVTSKKLPNSKNELTSWIILHLIWNFMIYVENDWHAKMNLITTC